MQLQQNDCSLSMLTQSRLVMKELNFVLTFCSFSRVIHVSRPNSKFVSSLRPPPAPPTPNGPIHSSLIKMWIFFLSQLGIETRIYQGLAIEDRNCPSCDNFEDESQVVLDCYLHSDLAETLHVLRKASLQCRYKLYAVF